MDQSGIISQSGFVFQAKLFLQVASSMKPGESVSYEYLDDISRVTSVDSLEARMDKSEIELFQVKDTKVAGKDIQRIFTNWILSYLDNENVRTFTLYYNQEKGSSPDFESLTAESFYSQLKKDANRCPGSNFAKLINSSIEEKIRKSFSIVKAGSRSIPTDASSIDKAIWQNMSNALHLDEPSSEVFRLRLEEVQRVVFYRIASAMLQRKFFRIDYYGLMKICKEACSNIAGGCYNPSFSAWMACKAGDVLKRLEGTREYAQLSYCFPDDTGRIMSHLYYGEYHRSLNFWRMENSQAGKVDDLEGVTFENYLDVVNELNEDGRDSPHARLRRTKCASNSFAVNDYDKWGSCIYLSADDAPDGRRISWKDEPDARSD